MKETKFKQTEVGMIPNDWEVKKLGAEVILSTETVDSALYKKEFYVGTENMLQDKAGITKNETVNPSGKVKGFKRNDILMSNIRPYLKKIWHANRDGVCSNDVLVFRVAKNAIVPCFLYSILSDDKFFAYVMENAVGTKMPRGDKKIIREYLFAYPPAIEEQKRIAQALSDVDAVITTTEKIIAKKKALKQGTMQTLLSGKMRIQNGKWIKTTNFKQTELGPIPQEWEVRRLGNLANIKTGKKNGNEAVENGKYPFFVRSQEVYRINTYSYDGEAILVPGEGNIGSIFHYVNGKFDFHQRVYKISDFPNNISCKFIYYVMKQYFGDWALKKTVKATVDSLRLDTFENFAFNCPSTKEEQTAIATVLSDMDSEIAALETKLAKYRQLKTGMMQQLLTGKVRLVSKGD